MCHRTTLRNLEFKIQLFSVTAAPEHLLQRRSTFTSQWWCLWVCPRWGERTWYSLILEWRSLTHTITRCFGLKLLPVNVWDLCPVLYLFNSPQLRLTERARQSTLWNDRHLRSFH